MRLLPEGTLYITDAGMCGAVDTVIGMEKEEGIFRFVKQLPVKLKVPEKPKKIQVSGILFEVDENGKAVNFERILQVYQRREDGSYIRWEGTF